MLRPLLVTLLIYCTILTAAAQQIDAAPETLKPTAATTISDWPAIAVGALHEIDVVTVARPGVRHKCEAPDLTAETLTCKNSHQHKPIKYNREDIAALIDPPSHQERNAMLVPIALMAASLIGSFFVPLGWSVTLRVFAGLCFSVFGAMSIGASGSDRSKDILLYQRANTPLTTKLHTR